MKRKPTKIKQYSPFEDRRAMRRKKILRNTALLAVLGVLFGAGWWLAKSGIDWMGSSGDDLPEVVIPEAVSIPDASAPEAEGAEYADIDGEDFAAVPIVTGGSWATAEHSELGGADLDETVQRLADSGVTHVLVTLKDADGTLYYGSGVAEAAGSINATAFDAARVAQAISDAGMVPAAGISAYEDSLAPYNARDMAIQLANGNNYLWLNNSPSAGGKPWLNPYSAKAQGYIGAILDEVLALGYREIVIDALQFPSGYGLEQANPAATGTVIGEAAQLQATAAEWQQKAAAAGAQCWFRYPAATLLGENGQQTGDSPFSFGISCMIAVVSSEEQATEMVELAEGNGVQAIAIQGAVGYEGAGTGMTSVSVFLN